MAVSPGMACGGGDISGDTRLSRFLALLRSHPTLSWIAIGFPDGGFFGGGLAALLAPRSEVLPRRYRIDRPGGADVAAAPFEAAAIDFGTLAVLGDLVEVAAQHLDDFVDRCTLVVAKGRQSRPCRLLQLQQQFA